MTGLTITETAPGIFDVVATGVEVTIVPYVPPIVVDPPPVDPPAPPHADGLVLTVDKPTVMAGDYITLSQVLYKDGVASPVGTPRIYGYNTKLLSSPNTWTPQLTALAAGTTTVKSDYAAGVSASVSVTVIANDGSVFPSVPSKPPAPPAGSPAPPAPPAAPPVAATPDTPTSSEFVTLTGTLSDGTVLNVTAYTGQRVAVDVADPSKGSVIYYGDGRCACIENVYTTTTGDISGNFTLASGGTVLFDGPLTIWARTRWPFWNNTPEVVADPDLSMFPTYGPGGESVDLSVNYAKANNAPMSCSQWSAGTANTGERADLGPLDQFSATYIKNPSAANAAVIFGLANASSAFPFHGVDFATGKMVDLSTNPKTAYTNGGQYGNTVPAITTTCPQSLSEAAAHAPTFFALACAIFGGTDYHREGLALWSNYVGGMWQTWSYRLPSGMQSCTHGQTRGKGRGLTTVLYASKLSDRQEYFTTWADSCGTEMSTVYLAMAGVQMDQLDAAYFGGAGVSTYQNHILIAALGQALDMGRTAFQPAFDHFATYLMDSILVTQHEFATLYELYFKDASGAVAADWAQVLQFTAAHSPTLAAALICAEGSQALQTAMGWTGTNPGDFQGYPTSSTGYAAMMQPALAALVNHATDQVRAKAAWAKFHEYQRIDYSGNPKYDVVP